MTVYDVKLVVFWVRKAISYQSNKVSVTSASLFILQMVRIEFDSLFRALSLHWFLSNWLIWWFTRFTPFPFTIITPSIWYWVPLLLLVFLSLDNEGPEAGEYDSNSPASYLVQDYIYGQLLKRTPVAKELSSPRGVLTIWKVFFWKNSTSATSYAIKLACMAKIRRKFTLTKLRSQIGWKVAFLRPPRTFKIPVFHWFSRL